jgi:hypothetical protein
LTQVVGPEIEDGDPVAEVASSGEDQDQDG